MGGAWLIRGQRQQRLYTYEDSTDAHCSPRRSQVNDNNRHTRITSLHILHILHILYPLHLVIPVALLSCKLNTERTEHRGGLDAVIMTAGHYQSYRWRC